MLFMTCHNRLDNVMGTYPAMIANQHLFGRFVHPQNVNLTDVALWDNWGLDNGAFGGFDELAFMRALKMLLPYKSACRFVVAPDVPFDWRGTLAKFPEWSRFIHALGFPVAIAAQDGATVFDVPWDNCQAVFIGGSTLWKREQYNDLPMFANVLTPRDEIIREAKRRGMWVHIGRQANSKKQLVSARHMQADSVDGTGEIFRPDRYFRWISQTVWELNRIT